ncbi:hypothetical protein [Solwaraspora sp. WMMA2065]|uniref:hypothetical protein n=1 Tax=Solwaraspora sp. WMMA2065 TaxID=3015166 RepID=UPI00259B13FF|nr:hypothetical protein [Solwaraspora sp. WMMA2065]WJK35499.1 hypothetical protein O7610_03720 [Solwaraspora sp. WMMA2065]
MPATADDVIAHQFGFLGPDTKLVTITVGGDNLGFTSTLENCIEALHDSICEEALDKAVAYIKTTLPGKLKQVYGDILAVAVQLNATIDVTATPYGVFVPVDALFATHRLCGSDPWRNDILHLDDAFHPNLAGYTDGYLRALAGAHPTSAAR